MFQQQQQYPQGGSSEAWKSLWGCTAGRPVDHGENAFFRPNANQRYSQYQDFDQDSFLVMDQEQPIEKRTSAAKDQQPLSGAAAAPPPKVKRNGRSKQKSRLSLSSLYTRQQQQPVAPPSHHNKGRGASTNYSQLPSPLSAATVFSPSSSSNHQQHQQLQERDNKNATVPLHYFENTLEEHPKNTNNWLDAATDTTQSSTTSTEPSSSSFAQQRKHLLPTPPPATSPAFFSPALRASLASMTPRNVVAIAKPALCFARLSSLPSTPQEEALMATTEPRQNCYWEEQDEQQDSYNNNASSVGHHQAKMSPSHHHDDKPLQASSGILQVPAVAETVSSLSCAEDDGFSIFGGMPQRLGSAFHKNKTSAACVYTQAAHPQPQRDHHQEDVQHWINRASHALEHHGVNHITTASAFLDLGQAYLRAQDFTSAQDVCKTAIRVYERTCRRGILSDDCGDHGDNDDDNQLRLAKALDVLGIAQSGGGGGGCGGGCNSNINNDKNNVATHTNNAPSKASLLLGIQSLRKSFRIRYDKLGPTHVDTVETLNKIANSYMALGMYSSACMDFREVMELRKAIMGEQHPSVAIAAQSVGNAHLKLKENSQAKAYYLQALNTFAVCGLADHKVAKKLRNDVTHLGFDLTRVEI